MPKSKASIKVNKLNKLNKVKKTNIIKKSGYNDDIKSNEKQNNNDYFADKVAKDCPIGDIVILDGKNMRSTETLLKKGIDSARIVIVENDHYSFINLKNTINKKYKQIRLIEGDIFDYLIKSSNKIGAIYLDLTNADISSDQLNILAKVIKRFDIKRIFLTLCSRPGRIRNMTIKKRLENIKNSNFGKIMNGLEYFFPYQRESLKKSASMFFMSFIREKCETIYRVYKIMYKSLDGKKAFVRWYGFPIKKDYTWELFSNVVEDD